MEHRIIAITWLLALGTATLIQQTHIAHPKTAPSTQKHARSEVQKDAEASTPDLIRKYGYSCEIHYVTTSDGYILQLHRIPYGRNNSFHGKRIPVLLQHGFLSSSADFVLSGRDNGLAFILADAGYDVWMGNFRGNTYSRNHTTLNPDMSKAFWQFSWPEMASFDLPTMLDYIINSTGYDSIFYVGHSMATTAFFAFMSETPEYNNKIRTMFALAPAITFRNMSTPIRHFAPYSSVSEGILSTVGMVEFLPRSAVIRAIGKNACDEDALTIDICRTLVRYFSGCDTTRLNQTLLPLFFGHFPAGTSTRTVNHFGQQILTGKYCHYDYGPTLNKEYYGQIDPPEYNVTQVTVPIVVFWSDGDLMAHPIDVQNLISLLPNVIHNKKVKQDNFSHLEFIWGTNAADLIYKDIVNLLKSL